MASKKGVLHGRNRRWSRRKEDLQEAADSVKQELEIGRAHV